MKVQADNGKWYTRDHPHEIISEYVMRFDEIRHWMKEFRDNPDYGWTSKAALERALTITKNGLNRKLTTGWIWPKEQVRLTHRIRDILDGRVVPKMIGKRLQAVIVDPPEPPKLSRPTSIKMFATVKGLSFLPPPKPVKIPDFKNAFAHASVYDPHKKGR